jgi:cytochrome c oxidase subunit 2
VVVTKGVERTLTIDEAYLRHSILDPAADVVKGFQPVMPVYKDLSPAEIDALLDFLKEVR